MFALDGMHDGRAPVVYADDSQDWAAGQRQSGSPDATSWQQWTHRHRDKEPKQEAFEATKVRVSRHRILASTIHWYCDTGESTMCYMYRQVEYTVVLHG